MVEGEGVVVFIPTLCHYVYFDFAHCFGSFFFLGCFGGLSENPEQATLTENAYPKSQMPNWNMAHSVHGLGLELFMLLFFIVNVVFDKLIEREPVHVVLEYVLDVGADTSWKGKFTVMLPMSPYPYLLLDRVLVHLLSLDCMVSRVHRASACSSHERALG